MFRWFLSPRPPKRASPSRLPVDTFRRSCEERIRQRLPQLLAFQTPRTTRHLFNISPEQRREALERLRAIGIPPERSSLLHDPHNILEYVVDAPKQPRPLVVKRAYRKDKLPPLRLTIMIDEEFRRCTLQYGLTSVTTDQLYGFYGDRVFARFGGKVMRGPHEIDALLSLAELIIADQIMLMRHVYFGEIGHGSGLYALKLDSLVTLPPALNQLGGHRFEHMAEAIIYTWSGEGDHHFIEPRYASIPH